MAKKKWATPAQVTLFLPSISSTLAILLQSHMQSPQFTLQQSTINVGFRLVQTSLNHLIICSRLLQHIAPIAMIMKRISKHLLLQLTLIVLAGHLLGIITSDPEPLQDFCVANTAECSTMFLNGSPCINPALAVSSHFMTSVLSKPGNTSANPFGFNVTLTNIRNLPGVNTQGLTMARVDIAANGHVPPHSHPRASEVTLLLKGTLLVGFVDTSNKLFTQQLREGDSFVFPKGLTHFLYNLDMFSPAVAVSGLNSQNPGAQLVALATFASKPPIPDEVLKKSFRIGGQDVERIRRNLGG